MSPSIIKLNNGKEMPIVGFGLWKVNNDTCAEQVYNAIKTGYRLFDGACGASHLMPFCSCSSLEAADFPPSLTRTASDALPPQTTATNRKLAKALLAPSKKA